MMEKVKGSATGARTGSILWGAAAIILFLALSWGSAFWWIGLPVYGVAVAACVRSVFLGVWVGPGEVVVSSWFRTYRFVEGDVSAVEKELYSGVGGVGGVGVGWLPFFGTVRMIEVELTTGKHLALPSTIGRRNSVLRLARRMRTALGLKAR